MRIGRAVPWLLTLCLTASMMAATAQQSLLRYREFRSGWSWDLAYYNQWFRALIHGEELSVRPIGPWVQEGPSVWKMNYLAPIRLAIVPIYLVFPGPRTLLIIQAVAIWMVIPAAFGLVRSESGSPALALSAAALVPLTPLLWPLAGNDFRELQLAPPFVLWAIHGVRARSVRLTVLGVGGLLACRQEFSLLVASLALLPPQATEDVGRRFRWARALWLTGLGWLLLGFLVYSRWAVNSYAFEVFLGELAGPRVPLHLTLRATAEFLLVGLGSWAVLACFAPRAAVLALPWILSLSGGRWVLGQIETEQWHHVRYATPAVAMVLGAGCLGYARLGAWLVAACGLLIAGWRLETRFARIPRPISSAEAEALWTWIDRVGPDDGVLAHYEVTAPLSSRRRLYSYVMEQNSPPGYPNLGREIGWAIPRAGDIRTEVLTDQGFRLVHDGPHILVFRREAAGNLREGDGQRVDPAPPGQESPPTPQSQPLATTEPGGVPIRWPERAYNAFGNAILTLTSAAWAVLFLAPGLTLSLWSRRRIVAVNAIAPAGSGLTGEEVAAARETARAFQPSRGDLRALCRDPLVFALRLGTMAGWLMMVAGAALWSWLPIQVGALLVSISVAVSLPLLWLLERDASGLAGECLVRAGVVREDDWLATATALSAHAWTEVAAVAPPNFGYFYQKYKSHKH